MENTGFRMSFVFSIYTKYFIVPPPYNLITVQSLSALLDIDAVFCFQYVE